jgi:hypothetical protein
MPTEELVTVWTGAMETAKVKAQQVLVEAADAAAARRERRSTHDIVVEWLRRHPWATMRAIADGTGVPISLVNGTLSTYAARGDIERSHQQHDRGNPVQWRVVR